MPLVIRERHGLALQVGQIVQAAADLLALEPAGHLVHHLVVRTADLRHPDLHGAVGGGLLGADAVHRPAVRDGEHPGGRRAAGAVVPRRRPPHLDEHLLRHLLGLGGIPQNPADQAVHARRDEVVQPREGRLVTARDRA
jgi:hypothetical protein